MYGLLLDSIQKFLREKYGEHYWVVIRRRAKLSNHWFVTHEVYSDNVMNDLVEAAASTLGEDRDCVMQMFGEYFVQNIGRYGYARLLRVLGRDMRDFLNGLDDLHEYLRFSYPKMRPPSFFCENETREGMIMHYTTKRRGYLPYVIGQLKAVGKIYNKDLEMSILKEDYSQEGCHVVLELKFDNNEFIRQRRPSCFFENLQLSGPIFLSIFPFSIVFNKDMDIVSTGIKMDEVLPGLRGKRLDYAFTHRRPQHVLLKWESIIMHTNCIFELVSIDCVTRPHQLGMGKNSPSMQYSDSPPTVKLKGQMLLMNSGEHMMFLCSPIMDSPEELYQAGIFINDLAMHDSTRDYILAGSQQNPELTLALNQEQIRTKQLEDSINKTDELIYQMIPKQIADKLRNGETPLNTCQVLPSVSILFSDIVSFTPMCLRLRPMEVVCVVNAMYVAFDQLCEKHHVYKVQTTGDAYMVLAGAPVSTPHHAEYITDFGFSIIDAMTKINDPSTGEHLKIRVGIHSGTVVAGVVGSTVLRYDVFGDSVNTAARMEATGMPMRIHVSEATALLLEGTQFVVQERGTMEVKGKGLMKTYWVIEKKCSHDEEEDTLNPFQKDKLIQSGRKERSASADIEDIVRKDHSKISSPLLPRFSPKQTTSFEYTPLPSRSNQRPSLSPHDWPQLDMSIEQKKPSRSPERHNYPRLSTSSVIPAILASHKGESIDLGDVRNLRQMSSSSLDIPEELKTLAAENKITLKEFAQIAEENALSARRVANWAQYIATIAEQQTPHDNIAHDNIPISTRRATVATISPTVATISPCTGSSVDKDDSENADMAISKQKDGNCIIL